MIQLLKDVKIGKFNVRRVCFGAKGVAMQSFFLVLWKAFSFSQSLITKRTV